MIAFLIVLIILGLILEYISLNSSFGNIHFEFQSDERTTEPDAAFYMIEKVSNTSWIPVTFLKTKILFPHGSAGQKKRTVQMNSFERQSTQRYFLLGHRRITRKVPLTLSERGLYWFEDAEMERGDFLGLRSSFTHCWGYSSIAVLPRRLKDSRSVDTLSGIIGDFLSKPYLMRDPILSIGVREYTGNEPMKTISWKKSAQRGSLMVREFDYTRERSCCLVVLGSVQADEDGMELCARIGRTAGEMLMEKGVQLQFFTNAYLQACRPFEIYESEASRFASGMFLDQLARIRPGSVAAESKLLETIRDHSRSGSQCIVITPCARGEADAFMQRLRTVSGSDCTVIYADDFREELR